MQYSWDEKKKLETIKKRSIDFAIACDFAWETAIIIADSRSDYGEDRFIATGYIVDRLYVMAFTLRGDIVRIISLRKANNREIKIYEKTTD
jgi:uncharacterized DUF497 family protein